MDISLKKFGGYSLIIGAVVSTLVFIMQVVLGSPPEPGTPGLRKTPVSLRLSSFGLYFSAGTAMPRMIVR